MNRNFPYNDCNECPRHGTDKCPISQHNWHIRDKICVFLKIRLPHLDIEKIKMEREAEEMAMMIRAMLLEIKREFREENSERECSYTEFHHMAFDAKTPDKQARHFQGVLISAAAIADLKNDDIEKAIFYVDEKGQARAVLPSDIKPLS